MTLVRLFGWTWDQWAIALAAFPLPTADHAGALKVRKEWMTSRGYEPGEERIATIHPNKDHEAAMRVFSLPLPPYEFTREIA